MGEATYARTEAGWQTFLRMQGTHERIGGPFEAGALIQGHPCPACGVPFVAGEWTALVPLGPGADVEAQERVREGRYYNARAIEVHWTCVTGEPFPAAHEGT